LSKGLRTLVLDIENSYVLGGVWGLFNQNLSLDQMLDYGTVLCWAAKWHGEKAITYRDYTQLDFLDELWGMLDDADAVLTYNGRRHDIPLLNREFIKMGMGPPSPFKHIDLYETVKRNFKFPSGKMQHVLTELNLPTKVEHEGFKLWVKCLEGDEKAWATMKKYNIQDVKVLEKLYDKMLPWINNHPNHSLHAKDFVCPHCGSKHLQSRGVYRTTVGQYRRYYCKDCQSWSRERFTELDLETRKKILVATNI